MTAAMVFAAGFGTRMMPLTADRPKPMVEVAGRPLIDHALAIAKSAGAAPVVVNTHYRPEALRAHLAGRAVVLSHEPVLLDTGGGLRAALPFLGPGPVLTLNSDMVWRGPNPFAVLEAAWDPARMDGLLLLLDARARGGAGSGDFALEGGRITDRPGPWTYSGAQMIRTKGLAEVSEEAFSLNVLWNRMLAQGRLYGLPYEGEWRDVGTPAGIAPAEALLAGTAARA